MAIEDGTLRPIQAFNLRAATGETTDVAAENPDVVERLLRTAREKDAEIKENSRPSAKVRLDSSVNQTLPQKQGSQRTSSNAESEP